MGAAADQKKWPNSIGVFADLIYRRDGENLYANMAFALYLAALAEQVDRVVVFGRLDPICGKAEHLVANNIEFVALPYYSSVADLLGVLRAMPRAAKAFARGARGLDCVWLFGPHPMTFLFCWLARLRGVPTCLGVRQDQPSYMRNRLTGRRRAVAMPMFILMERRFRRRARRQLTFVAGASLAEAYGGPPTVQATAFTVVDRSDIVGQPRPRACTETVELISVGRLDPEKNPLLMPAIVRQLIDLNPNRQWHLTVVGDGPLAADFDAVAQQLGVTDQITRVGYVSYGPELHSLYENADIMLHVSHTEGLPQVLLEAMAFGLPFVATDVGGVRALAEPVGAPLVPPEDAAAAAAAVAALAADQQRREACVASALLAVDTYSIQAQQELVLKTIAAHLGPRAAGNA